MYDFELNVTAGVQGVSSQVSKAALKGELHVYAKSEKEHILKVNKEYIKILHTVELYNL